MPIIKSWSITILALLGIARPVKSAIKYSLLFTSKIHKYWDIVGANSDTYTRRERGPYLGIDQS